MSSKTEKIYVNEKGAKINHNSTCLVDYLLGPFHSLNTLFEMAMFTGARVTLEAFSVICVYYVKALEERVSRICDEVSNKIGEVEIVHATYYTSVPPETILDYVLEPPAEKWRSPYIKGEGNCVTIDKRRSVEEAGHV